MSRFFSVTQVVPNEEGILAPSRISSPIESDGFNSTGYVAKVSFDSDGISNPVPKVIYMDAEGWRDGWYVLDDTDYSHY